MKSILYAITLVSLTAMTTKAQISPQFTSGELRIELAPGTSGPVNRGSRRRLPAAGTIHGDLEFHTELWNSGVKWRLLRAIENIKRPWRSIVY